MCLFCLKATSFGTRAAGFNPSIIHILFFVNVINAQVAFLKKKVKQMSKQDFENLYFYDLLGATFECELLP
jgi:hypothetical protein